MIEKLTLLVFLKDRSDFTKRLCHYLSTIKYPYPVYFADGSLGDENAQFFQTLENVGFFYTYKRYPKDLNLSDYFKKCHQSILEIKTPYVMLADNDDFPIAEGQSKAIQFLDKNPSYIGCNGRVPGIVLSPDSQKPYGKNILFLPYYCQVMDVQVKVDQDRAVERIEAYLKNFYSIYYSVFKTESLVCTFQKIEELNFSELGIVELFFSYMQLAQGKIKSIQETTYVRQKGSSQTAAAQKDWFYRLFYTNWLEDSQKAIRCVSNNISLHEDISAANCYESLYEQFVQKMRSRYIPNEFYLLKNVNKLATIENISVILFNKLFRVFPVLASKLSCMCFMKDKSIAFRLCEQVGPAIRNSNETAF